MTFRVFPASFPAVSVFSEMSASEDFYLRYYVGHKGKFGHEFLEFEFRPDGKLRYANNSNYKNDTMIRKEAYVHNSVMDELKRVIVDSEIMAEDDAAWPPPDRVGRQVRERNCRWSKKSEAKMDFSGTGDCDWGRTHLVHHIEDRLVGGREPVKGPRRSARLLLPRPGSEVFGVLPDWTSF